MYIGKNTKTEYAKTRIHVAITNLIYIELTSIGLCWLFVFLLDLIFKYYKNEMDNTFYIAILFILSFCIIFLIGLLITALIVNIILIKNNVKVIKYYKNNPLSFVCEKMLEYDSKLWLTAPKDTFHPMSFNITINNEKKFFKTTLIFTNSSTYYKIPKFKMPESLMAKNYIKNYAIIGYDTTLNEAVIIDFKKI